MEREVIPKIIRQYGLEFKSLVNIQKGYRNRSFVVELTNGSLVNFILYKNEEGIWQTIQRANALGDFAAQTGYPARHTVDPRIFVLRSDRQTRYGSLYAYLPGETIAWEAYTKEHIKNVGGALSTLHAAIGPYTGELTEITKLCLGLVGRMKHYFANPSVRDAVYRKLQITLSGYDFEPSLKAYKHLPNQQALHMDFVRGNILFTGKEVSGVLDFEKAAYGHPVFDIARTLAFLLVDCKFKDDAKVRKYFLHSGYNKRGTSDYKPIRINGKNVLEELVSFFLLHDFYKFLRHNPYEFLHQNEHYIRTRNLLLKRDIIS